MLSKWVVIVECQSFCLICVNILNLKKLVSKLLKKLILVLAKHFNILAGLDWRINIFFQLRKSRLRVSPPHNFS